jgi:hypothetical protein
MMMMISFTLQVQAQASDALWKNNPIFILQCNTNIPADADGMNDGSVE